MNHYHKLAYLDVVLGFILLMTVSSLIYNYSKDSNDVKREMIRAKVEKITVSSY